MSILLQAHMVLAAQLQVSPGDNLQTVLNNANAGDELILADGTYTGNGDVVMSGDYNMLLIAKDITIRAQNPGGAILDGQGTRRHIFINGGSITLDGLKFTRGYTARGGGAMWINQGTVAVKNCKMYSNSARNGGGGVYIVGGTVTFDDCEIYQNSTPQDSGGGMFMQGGTVTFTNCNIYSNSDKYNSGAAYYFSSGTLTLTCCTVSGSTVGSPITKPCSPPSPSLPPSPAPAPPPGAPPPPADTSGGVLGLYGAMPRIAFFGNNKNGEPVCELVLDQPMQRLKSTCQVHEDGTGHRMAALESELTESEARVVSMAEHGALKAAHGALRAEYDALKVEVEDLKHAVALMTSSAAPGP